MINTVEDDDIPTLSAEAMKALQEFYEEKLARTADSDEVEENWQLSQFWYDEPTRTILGRSLLAACPNGDIALVSAPSVYKPLKQFIDDSLEKPKITLFEFDKRFQKITEDYIFYDYKDDIECYINYKNKYDAILVDPPFLAEECLTKVSQFINFIGKPDCKIILCTGAVMEKLACTLLKLEKCDFQPKHEKNLANEFICLTNFGQLTVS